MADDKVALMSSAMDRRSFIRGRLSSACEVRFPVECLGITLLPWSESPLRDDARDPRVECLVRWSEAQNSSGMLRPGCEGADLGALAGVFCFPVLFILKYGARRV